MNSTGCFTREGTGTRRLECFHQTGTDDTGRDVRYEYCVSCPWGRYRLSLPLPLQVTGLTCHDAPLPFERGFRLSVSVDSFTSPPKISTEQLPTSKS